MTEVDVVLPEGVAEPTNKLASASNSPKSSPKEAAAAEQTSTSTATAVDKKPRPRPRQRQSDGEDDGDEVTTKQPPLLESNINSNSNSSSSNSNDDSSSNHVSKKKSSSEKEEAAAAAAVSEEDVIATSDVAAASPTQPPPPPPPASSDEVAASEAMEVDADADEDSQITSSSSTDLGNGNTKDAKQLAEDDEAEEAEEEEEEATTNGDHDEEDDDVEKVPSTAESSCDALDGEDPLAAALPDEEMIIDEDENEEEKKKEDKEEKMASLLVEDEDESQQSGTAKSSSDDSEAAPGAEADELEEEESRPRLPKAKKETLNGFVASEKEKLLTKKTAEKPQKENGTASAAEEAAEGVVNLDDDSSDEEEEADDDDDVEMTEPTTAKAKSLPTAKPPSGAESSDDAVLIASDSESEMVELPKKPAPAAKPTLVAAVTKPPPPDEDDDDDDDDCVVIEDDTPPSISPSTDLLVNKRKGLLADLDENPSKRQRSNTPSSSSTVGQLTIKDARSLMPHEAPSMSNAVAAAAAAASVYPVTITNAVTGAATNLGLGSSLVPPKLLPLSNASTLSLNPPTLSLSGLPSMTNNANLLPGLTDDMFVLEAPSFIVPYIYEKPPNDNIRDVVKAIESKYALSPEDLADPFKSDEFDMMTEQNKDEKPAEGAAADAAAGVSGRKKKKGGDDESWSEQSDEDDDEDDDDDSESGVRTKVLIKEASDDLSALKSVIKPAAAIATAGGTAVVGGAAGTVNNANVNAKPGQENYFESPLGKFFMDIGVGLVQEYVQSDLLRLQKRKLRKSVSRDLKPFEMAVNALSGNLKASKAKNAPFKFTMKRCEFCNFKSESALSMANHYETPHMNGVLYKCNFCTFEIRNATEIVYHMEAVHNIKARLIKPLPYHQCPNCGFEDNGKAKLARHQPVCAKKFRPELNLAPPNDWEAPAKIPRIKPRHGLVGTATAYQAMAAQAAAQKAALATIQQQQAAAQARNLQAAALAAQNAAKMRARAPQLPKVLPTGNTLVRNPAPVRNAVANPNLSLPSSYQLAAGQLVQQASKKPIAGQPSISITPLPRQSAATSGASAAASSSKMPQAAAGMKPGQSPSGNNKAQFVICEICDGYIKDLEQLRNHMQWMHKVKIHPKMIYNRPPLNCQKCQFRFFTDQGLERHLLGSHGLVTSSMQEAANKGKDAGRCPVCGRMYQWKLLNHVSRDHHMTLKPAHLSYKCTVCTATFGMYKQFETHVYTAHSTVAKKAMDSKKNSAQQAQAQSSRNSLGAANDSLLKPLKINDEITIIPQPASKPRITNMESHVID